jgi:type VI secretion system protein ImpK
MSADETVIGVPLPAPARPNPGGRLSVVAAGPASSSERLWDAICVDRLSPLVAAALPLLDLCVRFKTSTSHADVEGLRLRVLHEIDAFERRVTPLGLAPRSIRASKYALCATIDDLVLNTPWGSRSIWTTRSIVGSLFSDTWGGDRFFDLLTQLKKDPGINVDLLELLYYCISLGFEGKYRIAPRGASELTVLREDLYRLIRAARGEFERDISPRWRGVTNDRRGMGDIVPNWVIASIAVLALVCLYAVLAYLLNGRSDRLLNQLASLPPNGMVSLARAAIPPPPPVIILKSERLRRFLEPEIRDGLVTVTEDAQTITVLIRGVGMFDSGSAAVKPSFTPLLLRIGEALNEEPGSVLVTGHTDTTPIHSLAFPSNWHLSAARAKNVGQLLQSKMNDPGRVTEEGLGDTQPIAPNDTADGRQKNRRIEIIITKPN